MVTVFALCLFRFSMARLLHTLGTLLVVLSTDTSVNFYTDGKKLATVSGSDEKGAYVELDVYAYVLAGTITYGEGGSYHISNFLENSAGADHENLVACFIKYVESAADYRLSVIGK